MKKITRAVTLEDVRDLAERPPGALLGFVWVGVGGGVGVVWWLDGARWFVTLPRSTTLRPGAPVVLLIDDGDRYFELRGLRITGALAPGSATEFEVVPDKTIAWHYGTLRRQAT
jgi:hypothetical protein